LALKNKEIEKEEKRKQEAEKVANERELALKNKEIEKEEKRKQEAEKAANERELALKNKEIEKEEKRKLEAEKATNLRIQKEKKEAERQAALALKTENQNNSNKLNNNELNVLLDKIDHAKLELSNLRKQIDSSKIELDNVLNNIELAKEDYKKEQIKIENSKSYLITLNDEILAKINEVEKSRNNKVDNINPSNLNNNINNSEIIYSNTDLSNNKEKTYRIQIFACVICSKIPSKFLKSNKYKIILKLREEGLNKFFVFESTNKDLAYQELAKVREYGFSDAFIACYLGSNKVKID
jgi:hypothetical protein